MEKTTKVSSHRRTAPTSRRPVRRGIPSSREILSSERPVAHSPSIPREDRVRIIPLGGVEEVGRNMTIVEYKDDIILIDAGLQFPEEETPGIDYIIPNTKYLQNKLNRIRGLIISHGHLDHIGGIPYLFKDIGNPPIYTSQITKAMIMKRQEEFTHAPKLNIIEVKTQQTVKIGKYISAKFFTIAHNVPDAIGIILETPIGNIVYPGDFKIDRDENGEPLNVKEYGEIGKENNLVLLLESTNAEKPGFSISEREARDNIKQVLTDARGRVIIGTFSSLMERVIEAVSVSEELGKKVVIDGYSMKANLEIVQNFGFFNPKKDTIISAERMSDYPNNKIVIICTGAQGEENATLMRVANKRHKSIKIVPGDAVILSSSVIPGNEKSIQNLKDNLSRQGAIIVHSGILDVHASGHACQEELKLMTKLINPKFFIPIHGHYFMLRNNATLAESLGIPAQNIVVPLNNGAIIEATKEKIEVLAESAPANYVMVDGLGVGDVKEVVLRDRQMLAQDGIFVIITVIDSKTGRVRSSPDIISRGFIYLRESQDLLKQTRHLIVRATEEAIGKMHPINITYVKEVIRERVAKFLFQKTKRRPIILPVLIEV